MQEICNTFKYPDIMTN